MKYNKIAECPPELQELIELVNLLPSDLKQFENDLNKLSSQFYQEFQTTPELYSEVSKNYSQKLASWFNSLKANGFVNQTMEIKRLINNKITLLWFIEAYQTFKEFNNPTQDFNFDKNISAFSFNEDSTIRLTSFLVVDILIRNKIQIERLRICPICKKVFWAKRVEAQTCRKKQCSNNFHQRKLRIKEYETRLVKELKILEGLRLRLNPSNSLITQQAEMVNKLQQKIKMEKKKNGNL